MKKEDIYKFSIRTDLAVEAREMIGMPDSNDEIFIHTSEYDFENISVDWVEVLTEAGEKKMGKPIGNYITIESALMKENVAEIHENIITVLSDSIARLAKLSGNSSILVIGLGNWNVTPDALGPKVVSKTLVTRHILESVAKEIDESVRPVSAVSPGVMGITGIETAEIVSGIVSNVKPDLVIAIDALAARRTSRINSTIQISDTGISPGAGMGNKRTSLNKDTLGVPVIAIGVPTVVDAATLVNDTIDFMIDSMISQTENGSDFYNMLKGLENDEKYQLIVEILNPYAGNMFVTPKEVDAVVDRLANIIANGINIALHPGIDKEDINRYVN